MGRRAHHWSGGYFPCRHECRRTFPCAPAAHGSHDCRRDGRLRACAGSASPRLSPAPPAAMGTRVETSHPGAREPRGAVTIDPDTFRSVLGRFASGITVLTARDEDDNDCGMTISAFCSVSLVPPLVLVCVDRVASMHDMLLRVSHFAVNILAAHQEALS